MNSHLTEHDARLLRSRIGRWYSARVAYEWDLPQLVGPLDNYQKALLVARTEAQRADCRAEVAKIKRAMRRIEKNMETSTALLEGLINKLEGKPYANQPQ